MGTRHLVEVDYEWKPRIAQYGQWDWYISWQGATVLEFLKNCDFDKFKKSLADIRFSDDDDELEKLWQAWWDGKAWISRDTWAGILQLVYDGKVKVLHDNHEFKNDSLFCEYYYIIDLDKMTLNVNGYKTYKLNKLPTLKKMMKDFGQDDE